MSIESVGDLILAGIIGYVAIGFIMFLLETLLEWKFYDTILYDFSELDKTSSAIILLLGCVGAWPMIMLFEWLKRDKNGRKSRW